MSQICTTSQCERSSRVLCDCCQQNLCFQHFNDHLAALVLQLNPMVEQMDILVDQFNSLTRLQITFDSSERKEQEFNHLASVSMTKLKENMFNAHRKLEKLIHDQEPTKDDIERLQSSLNDLQREMNQMERIYSQIKSNPTIINDSINQLEKLCYQQQLNPSIFSTVYKTIVPPSRSFRALCASNQFLLTHQKPNLCLLDTELNVIKHTLWSKDNICDIVWCSMLKRFIIIGVDTISLVNPNTMFISSLMTDQNEKWRTGACFQDHLFLSTNSWGSSIVEFELVPRINVIKEWKSPITCALDEAIDDITCNDDVFSVVIRNRRKRSIRMELRFAETFERLWSIVLDIPYDVQHSLHCSSLDSHGWLVADSNSKRFFEITADGHLKQIVSYNEIPIRTCPFGSNMLLVATNGRLNAHKM